jgi:hypothetical protein
MTSQSDAWRHRPLATLLLACGIAAPLLYVAMNAIIPLRFEGYSVTAQTVSELSAIGAPTRALWVPLGALYAALVIAFGIGVWSVAGTTSKPLRVVAVVTVVNGALSLVWPPMHLRGAEFSLTDTLHIVWSAITVVMMLIAVAFGATAFGARFRRYSIATFIVMVVFGGLTGIEGPRIAANLPTPWIGVWERIAIAAYMVWIAVLAVVLSRYGGATGRQTG